MVLDRSIAERGRFPPVNVLRSISRTMPQCNTEAENAIVDRARQFLATYEDMAELIRLGAYRQGSDAQVDEAIHYYPAIEAFLAQAKADRTELSACYRLLAEALDMPAPETAVAGAAPEAAPEAEQAPVPGVIADKPKAKIIADKPKAKIVAPPGG